MVFQLILKDPPIPTNPPRFLQLSYFRFGNCPSSNCFVLDLDWLGQRTALLNAWNLPAVLEQHFGGNLNYLLFVDWFLRFPKCIYFIRMKYTLNVFAICINVGSKLPWSGLNVFITADNRILIFKSRFWLG